MRALSLSLSFFRQGYGQGISPLPAGVCAPDSLLLACLKAGVGGRMSVGTAPFPTLSLSLSSGTGDRAGPALTPRACAQPRFIGGQNYPGGGLPPPGSAEHSKEKSPG